MPKVYINNVLQKTEILPSNTPTEDETLETFSFSLLSNDNPLPLAPGQAVKIDLLGDETEFLNLIIAADSVETFSLKPLKYKHNISCVQNTRTLSKHIVRNSVFTQPAYLQKGSFNATNCGQDYSFESGQPLTWTQLYVDSLNWASEKLALDKNEKIKNPYLKISFQYSVGSSVNNQDVFYPNAHTTSDILANVGLVKTLNFNDNFTLRYKNSGGTTVTQAINASTFGVAKLDLNAVYPFPLIKTLADQGCNDFEILFNSFEVITGTWKTSGEIEPTTPQTSIQYYQIQVQIVAEAYYWSCYDILDLLLKRQAKSTSRSGLSPVLFALPQSGELYDLLKNTVAPNFTFTQLTMYECVAEVFRLFDAIFTMDENKVLGIDYFNDLSRESIKPGTKFSGRNLALGEDKYINGFVSHYQDARTIESFPKEEGVFAPVRSAEFGVPEEQDHSFIVPHAIDMIIKCEILVEKFNINDGARAENGYFSLDITNMVFTEDVWSTLNTGAISGQEFVNRVIKQANTVYYARGDNKIQLAATFKDSWNMTEYSLYHLVEYALVRMAGASAGVEPTDDYKAKWSKIKMRLTYTTSVDGIAKVHSNVNKYEGETLIDQANGAVDLNKLGVNMLGLSLKLGNPSLNATHTITSWANRIQVGQIYEWQGKTWIANVANYTFFGNNRIQGKVSFVQNFNALSLRTQLLREKRMSNISKELVQKSEEVITDFAYFSSINTGNLGLPIHFRDELFQEFVYDSFKLSGVCHKVYDAFLYDQSEVDLTRKVKAIYIPTVRYGAGNTVNFEMSFDHPMNAGNQTTIKSGTWLGENEKYFTNHVIYTTNNDDEMIIYLGDNDDKFSAGFLDRVSIKFPESSNQYDSDFPIVTIDASRPLDQNQDGFINIVNYEVYKQPNEIFALNYQIAFLPTPGRENVDFIGPQWINNNCFVKDIDSIKKTLYIVFKEEKMSSLDLKAAAPYTKREILNVLLDSAGADHFSLSFSFNGITTETYNAAKSWAIVDENDNVLFASNYKQSYLNWVQIFFFTRPTRLN